MQELFLQILNMSVTGSYVIAAVLLMRLVLKKAPKRYSYLLWSVVGFRLCCPVSFSWVFSLFSLQPFDMTTAQQTGGGTLHYFPGAAPDAAGQFTTGISYVNQALHQALPPEQLWEPWPLFLSVGCWVWAAGMLALLGYSLFTMLRLKKQLSDAIRLENGVFCSHRVRSPFILGFFRPRIYLPFGLSAPEQEYVLAHELFHLRRLDHLVRLFGYLLLALHWFNPLCWLAFSLMCRDMEMRCDEQVLSQNESIRRAYSTTLLSFAANCRFPLPEPLAFGESGVKIRIRNVLGWKKPRLWVTAAAAVLCGAVLIGCAANPSASLPLGTIQRPESLAPELLQTARVLYWNPLSSLTPGYGEEQRAYRMEGGQFSCLDVSTGDLLWAQSTEGKAWHPIPYTGAQWEELFLLPNRGPSLDDIGEPLMLDLSDKYSLFDMDGTLWLMEWRENPQMGRYVWSILELRKGTGWSFDSSGKGGAAAPELVVVTPIFSGEQDLLDAALSRAILEQAKSDLPDGLYHTESHVILSTAEGVEADRTDDPDAPSVLTVYAMVMQKSFSFSQGELRAVHSSHTPAAITFAVENGVYELTEYRTPREGALHQSDLAEMFPPMEESMLDLRNYQRFQSQQCYQNAVEYFSAVTGEAVDTAKTVRRLLDTIASAPAWSSNTMDYIEAHPEELQELLHYGRYTLQACFARFLQGNETGLEGHIMAFVCNEIAVGWGEALVIDGPAPVTGQDWFHAFRSMAQCLAEQHSQKELQNAYPASFLLLEML